MLKRAWLSITRRKAKTILLFIILFVVANLVISTIAIKNATEEATNFAKESIRSEVTLSKDMGGAREEFKQSQEEKTDSDKSEEKIFEMPTISINDALSIAESEKISGYSYGFTAYANVDEIEVIESEMEKMEDITMDSSKATNPPSGNRGGFGGNQEFKFSMKDIREQMVTGDIQIEAVNSFNSISGVVNGTIELSSGAAFTSEDENVAIISYDLAEKNELEVGDEITLVHTETEKKTVLKVVGIYENTESQDQMRNMMMNSSNTIYTNLKTGETFMTEEKYNNGDYEIESCVYYLNSPEEYDAFVQEANAKVDLEAKNLKLTIDESTYERMVGSIEQVGSFASVVFWVVVAAAVVLITLIINGQIKERHYEMGVLLSLGEKRTRIVGQIAIELVLIATVAFLVSMLTGGFIANKIGDNLKTTQTELKTEQMEMMGNRGGRFEQNMEEPTESLNIDVSVGLTECGVLFGVGYLIIIFAMILPGVSIFRYDPKTILSRRE